MSYPTPQGRPGPYPTPYPGQYPTQYVTPLPPRSSTGHVVIAWILAVLTGFYLLPWAIAATRSKRNVGAIVLINIFLGWTLAGWIAALVMACLNDDRPTVLTVYQPVAYPAPQPIQQQYQQPYQPYLDRPPAGYPAVAPHQASLPGPTQQAYPRSSAAPASQPTAAYPEPESARYPSSASSGWSRSEDEPTQVLDDFQPPYGGPRR